jgi:hypothetical protein
MDIINSFSFADSLFFITKTNESEGKLMYTTVERETNPIFVFHVNLNKSKQLMSQIADLFKLCTEENGYADFDDLRHIWQQESISYTGGFAVSYQQINARTGVILFNFIESAFIITIARKAFFDNWNDIIHTYNSLQQPFFVESKQRL